MASCRLNLLGGFALVSGGGGKLNLPTRKDRLLLAYLALKAGQPQARRSSPACSGAIAARRRRGTA